MVNRKKNVFRVMRGRALGLSRRKKPPIDPDNYAVPDKDSEQAVKRNGEDFTSVCGPSSQAVKEALTEQNGDSVCSEWTEVPVLGSSYSIKEEAFTKGYVEDNIPELFSIDQNQQNTVSSIASEAHELGSCRCCLAQISCNRNQYGNTSGVLTGTYQDMLLTTFGITVTQVQVHSDNTLALICSDCKTRLQNAFAFKQQVLEADKSFVEKVESGLLNVFEAENENMPNVAHVSMAIEENSCGSEIVDANDDGIDSGYLHDAAASKELPKLGLKSQKQKNKAPSKESGMRCEICRKMEDNCFMMSYHVKRNHHRCHKCSKIFRNKFERFEHELTHPRVCELCKEEFNTDLLLRIHTMQVHKTKKFHKCADCEEISASNSRLLQHRAEAHGAPVIKCGACNKICRSQTDLSTHHRVYHMMERNYPCTKCDYRAGKPENLKRHMIRHSSVKNLECQYCHKKFARHATLRCHERIHTGDKRQVCRLCGAAFVQRASLKYHLEKQHPGQI